MSKQLSLPTLLIIADNASIRFWIKKHLEDRFFIIQATSRSEAISAFNAQLDLILIDSAFENCDALALCKEITKFTQNKIIPILLITGRLKKSYRKQAEEAGVTDFISDQLDIEELEMKLASLKKAAVSREKIGGLSSVIKGPKIGSSDGYLKNKFLLSDPALRILASAKKQNTAVMLILARIDSFAELDNKDEILPRFSSLLSRALRSSDVLIPSSEGGFVLLLPGMNKKEAHAVAEKLQGQVLSQLSLTASFVVVALDGDEGAFNKMVESAFKSLKQAKTTSNTILSLDSEYE